MTEEGIERAAKLLFEGAVMLKESCPECSHPIYRKKDTTLYCANCDRPIVREDQDQEKEVDPAPADSPIQRKIDLLGKQLETETDFDKIKEISATIRELEKIRDS